MKIFQSIVLLLVVLSSCTQPNSDEFFTNLNGLERIESQISNQDKPYLTAGSKLYVISNQDPTESNGKSGVWLHSIKLLDGFYAEIKTENQRLNLNRSNALIYYPVGNEQVFHIDKIGIEVSQFQFVPDDEAGLIVAYQIENTTAQENEMQFSIHSALNLRPVKKNASTNVQDEGEWRDPVFIAKDKQNPWFAALGGKGFKPLKEKSEDRIKGQGKGFTQSLTQNISLEANETKIIYFVVTGSSNSKKEAIRTHKSLIKNAEQLLTEKIGVYQEIKKSTHLDSRDKSFNLMFSFAKYNSKMMQIFDEYEKELELTNPKHLQWFERDKGFETQGLLAAGMHEQALEIIDGEIKLLQQKAANRMILNPSNPMATAQFVHALWQAYSWTAQESLLDYYDVVTESVTWVESQKPGENTELSSIEISKMTQYQYQMYRAATNFAKVKQQEVQANEYNTKASEMKNLAIASATTESTVYQGATLQDLPTASQIVSEAQYGDADKALEYLKIIENPSVFLDTTQDVSSNLWNLQQSRNIYTVAVPVVENFFGIHPKAWKQEIVFTPNLPTEWNDVSLTNIRMGNNMVDISAKRIGKTLELRLSQLQNWKTVFEFSNAKYITYDGNRIEGGKVELYDRVHNLKVEF